MIRNEGDLDQTIAQIGRMVRVVAALRADARLAESPQLGLLAEGPLEELRRLCGEIDAYTGADVRPAIQTGRSQESVSGSSRGRFQTEIPAEKIREAEFFRLRSRPAA
jgi:hypothetical protein